MWKKDEHVANPGTPAENPAGAAPRNEPVRSTTPKAGPVSTERATIGRSITIKGDVTGQEDLVIQGSVQGTVDLKQHAVTIGQEGRVKANVSGRNVIVEGEVEGDVKAQEQVCLRASSKVFGDIVAPRVTLEDGATFRGSIDMTTDGPGAATKPPAGGTPPAKPSSPKAPEGTQKESSESS